MQTYIKDHTMNENMNIIFATNNNFCSHAAEAIVSLLENNKKENIIK